jgi:hypothetical protein
MSYLSVGPGMYQMHSPDSNLSAGGKDWSSAPWVDWGGNPNTAGPSRIAVGATQVPNDLIVGGDPSTWTPGWGKWYALNKVPVLASAALVAVVAGYFAYRHFGEK